MPEKGLSRTEKVALAILCAEEQRRRIPPNEMEAALRHAFEMAYLFMDVSKKYGRVYE